MHTFPDFTSPHPDDWDDNEKYPNKRLENTDPEKGYVPDSTDPYPKMIFETWRFDNPEYPDDPFSGLKFFVRCPKCGSYHIKKCSYDNLRPGALAGSAGIKYECNDCGYSRQYSMIQS